MSAIAVISGANHRRIGRARAWLQRRVRAEEVLIIGASLDAANELVRRVAEEKGAAFGWLRLTLPQPRCRARGARACTAEVGAA